MDELFYKGTVTFEFIARHPMDNMTLEEILETADDAEAMLSAPNITGMTVDRAEANTLAETYGADSTFFDDTEGE